MKYVQPRSRTLMTLALSAFWLVAGTGCLECCEFGEDTVSGANTCEEEDSCEPAPGDCRFTRPSEGRLTLAFSTPLPVEVRVYEGEHFETGRLAKAWTPQDTTARLSLPFGRYAATALYVRGGDTVLVVDGDGIQVEAIDTCEGPCYEIRHGEMDLELRE